jgi:hypothetical protein
MGGPRGVRPQRRAGSAGPTVPARRPDRRLAREELSPVEAAPSRQHIPNAEQRNGRRGPSRGTSARLRFRAPPRQSEHGPQPHFTSHALPQRTTRSIGRRARAGPPGSAQRSSAARRQDSERRPKREPGLRGDGCGVGRSSRARGWASQAAGAGALRAAICRATRSPSRRAPRMSIELNESWNSRPAK